MIEAGRSERAKWITFVKKGCTSKGYKDLSMDYV